MWEKEFAPYELAVKLKELGFNEMCLTKYGMSSLRFYDNYVPYRNSEDIYEKTGRFFNDLVSAPLWQQAARFLSISSNNQINISINGEDNYENLFKKLEQAIKDFRDL